jgi:hypothetical protein
MKAKHTFNIFDSFGRPHCHKVFSKAPCFGFCSADFPCNFEYALSGFLIFNAIWSQIGIRERNTDLACVFFIIVSSIAIFQPKVKEVKYHEFQNHQIPIGVGFVLFRCSCSYDNFN